MALVPTPEKAARLILSQFKAANIRAGEILMRGAVEIKAQKDGLSAPEVGAGLGYGVENGWFDVSNQSFVKLTDVGFGVM